MPHRVEPAVAVAQRHLQLATHLPDDIAVLDQLLTRSPGRFDHVVRRRQDHLWEQAEGRLVSDVDGAGRIVLHLEVFVVLFGTTRRQDRALDLTCRHTLTHLLARHLP